MKMSSKYRALLLSLLSLLIMPCLQAANPTISGWTFAREFAIGTTWLDQATGSIPGTSISVNGSLKIREETKQVCCGADTTPTTLEKVSVTGSVGANISGTYPILPQVGLNMRLTGTLAGLSATGSIEDTCQGSKGSLTINKTLVKVQGDLFLGIPDIIEAGASGSVSVEITGSISSSGTVSPQFKTSGQICAYAQVLFARYEACYP